MLFSWIPQAYAACESGEAGLDLTDCLTLGDGSRVADVYNQPTVLVNLLISNIFIVAGFILFFLLIAAGFKFITGATKGKDEAKEMLEAALIGFIIMFSAYWIMQIVKIITGIDYLGF
jgi:hypothetical protein